MATFLFPGQGSQKVGMGDTLFEEFPDITQSADALLGYSIQSLCLEDSQNQLGLTAFTQPALYTVNALMMYKRLQTEAPPQFCAGHSLGEYNALLAAEVFSFEDGLRLVQKRGELMGQAQGGAMAAIIGLPLEKIQSIITTNALAIEIANLNSPLQTVITGKKDPIEQSLDLFKQAGARLVVPLKVSGAFHSSLMAPAQKEFTQFLSQFTFKVPKVQVIANVTAAPYTPETIADLLAKQITSSVRWTETIRYLLALGQTEFLEVGPGKVLAGLVQAIQKV